jgi:LysR family transcriptional regulator, glycine cleavage system transcriptional activator
VRADPGGAADLRHALAHAAASGFPQAIPGDHRALRDPASPFDFRLENIDAAIHYGKQDWPDTESRLPDGRADDPSVCSPRVPGRTPPARPADLAGTMLLHISSRAEAWANWFRAQGVAMPECAEGMYFEQFITAAQAAVAGLGTALIPKFLLKGELERGEW